MKKSAVLYPLAAWLILAVVLMLFAGAAQAYVYDDFTSAGINPSKWSDNGPNYGFFSQPGDGYLHYSDPGNINDRLKSANPVSGAFFLSMQYSNFQATNSYQGGQFQATTVELMVAVPNYGVFVLEGNKGGSLFFQAAYSKPGDKQNLCAPIPTSVDSGWLGIGYNGISGPGGQLTLWYNAGAGWTELATYAPNFSQTPIFQIAGYDPPPSGQSLSFRVDQVQLTPVPPSLLLLGSGLAGLAGWRRLRKG